MTGSGPYLLFEQCPRPGTYKVQQDFGTFPNKPVRGHPGPSERGHHGLRAERGPGASVQPGATPGRAPLLPRLSGLRHASGHAAYPTAGWLPVTTRGKSSPRPRWPQRGDLLSVGQNPGRVRNLRPVPSQTPAQAEREWGDQEGGRWMLRLWCRSLPRHPCPPTPGTRERLPQTPRGENTAVPILSGARPPAVPVTQNRGRAL